MKIAPDKAGITRIFFNDEPCLMFGPLDQGFWPDGLYTPPTDAALKYDIEYTKKLGFNMIRKHVKVEPDRWYYWCDKLGIIVWQDMPSGDKSIRPEEPDIHRTPESAHQYETELKAMIDNLRNHPSILCWLPFNEGWGQFDTARITDFTRALDPTRLVGEHHRLGRSRGGRYDRLAQLSRPQSPQTGAAPCRCSRRIRRPRIADPGPHVATGKLGIPVVQDRGGADLAKQHTCNPCSRSFAP